MSCFQLQELKDFVKNALSSPIEVWIAFLYEIEYERNLTDFDFFIYCDLRMKDSTMKQRKHRKYQTCSEKKKNFWR